MVGNTEPWPPRRSSGIPDLRNFRIAGDTSKMPNSGEISVSWRFIANSRLPRDVPLLCLASSCGNRFLFTRPFRRQDIRYRRLANHLIRIFL